MYGYISSTLCDQIMKKVVLVYLMACSIVNHMHNYWELIVCRITFFSPLLDASIIRILLWCSSFAIGLHPLVLHVITPQVMSRILSSGQGFWRIWTLKVKTICFRGWWKWIKQVNGLKMFPPFFQTEETL